MRRALPGLAVAFLGPPLFVIVPDHLFGVSPPIAIAFTIQLLYCSLVPLLLYIVVRHEQLTLASIGLSRPRWTTAAWAALLWGIISAVPLITVPLVKLVGSGGMEAGLERLSRMPIWFRMVVALTGGAVEETLYRGYAVERLATITGNTWLGGGIAALVFGLSHAPFWGMRFALATDLPFGVVMTAFYLWRRDVVANILAHSTALAVAMLTVVP